MSRANPTLVGAFVVGGLALAAGAAIALGARGASSKDIRPFVVQLEGTVNGLRVGAPVKFKGIQVGSVERIAIRILPRAPDVPVAVLCSIDEERLDEAFVGETQEPHSIQELVAAGMRARLATESMVTGILYISLMFLPEEPGVRHGDLGAIPEVPAVQSTTERLESGIERLLTKLQELDLAGLVDEAKTAVKSIGELGASPEIRTAITNLEQTLASTRRSAEQIEKDLDPLMKGVDAGLGEVRTTIASLQKLADQIEKEIGPFSSSLSAAAGDVGGAARDFSETLDALGGSTNPNSPLIVHLQATLLELAGAARSARALLEQLERDPSQLLRGRSVPEGDSK